MRALSILLLVIAALTVAPPPAVAAPSPDVTDSDAEAILQVLRAAPDEGFGPRVFADDALVQQAHASDPAVRAEGRRRVVAALLRYARAAHGSGLPAGRFPEFWAIRPQPFDADTALQAALSSQGLQAWLASLPPSDARYRALVEAYRRYDVLARQGGWSSITDTVKPGDSGPAVAALRARLAVEDPATPSGPDLFDDALKAAVARAQTRYGLEADGIAGRATLAALNVSATARAEEIAANLERWRWMPRILPDRRVELNIADATLFLLQPGQPAFDMRVIVGKPATPTPMFADGIQAIVLNPPWNIPAEIAAKEIWPKIRKDPGYMERERIVVKPDGGLQQLPGPKCALGLIKFDLSNPFGVYLHDTPVRSLFAQNSRALSHGCMRVEKPNALAKALLRSDPKWGGGDAVDVALLSGRTLRIPLRSPLPLYVSYWTAFVDDQGQTQFRPDIYGWNSKLRALLASTPDQG